MDKVILLSSTEIGERLKQIYEDNYLCYPSYHDKIVDARHYFIENFSDPHELFIRRIEETITFIKISSDYLSKKKAANLFLICDIWTLLSFDNCIQNAIEILLSLKLKDKVPVPVSDKKFLIRFAMFSFPDVSGLLPD